MSRPTPPPPAPSPTAVPVPLDGGGVTSGRDAAPLAGGGTGYSGPVSPPMLSHPAPGGGSGVTPHHVAPLGGAGDRIPGSPYPLNWLRGWR